jgi:predicted ArsR family transcriptional regulator
VAEQRKPHSGRQAVLDAVRESDLPVSVAEAAGRVGLHVNTVRSHLALLVHLGRVTREVEHRATRGRPRILYQEVADGSGGEDPNQTLAQTLANALSLISRVDQQRTADDAGMLCAKALVDEGRLVPTESAEEAIGQVARLFSDLGFDATTEPLGDRLYLSACPYSAVRDTFPEVCGLHIGLIRGSLAMVGAGVVVDRFDIDARPNLCVAHLSRATASAPTVESATVPPFTQRIADDGTH